jgi:hypothetical protein
MDQMMSLLMKMTKEIEELKKQPKIETVEQFQKYQLPTEQIFGKGRGTARPSVSLPYAIKSEHLRSVDIGLSQENSSAHIWGRTLGGAPAELPQFENSQQESSGTTNSLAQNWGQTLGGAPAGLPHFEMSQQERIHNSQNQSDQLTAKLVDVANAFASIGTNEQQGPALQRFDGTPQEYRSWRMLFNKKVHEKAIPKAVKLEKLKFALSGEAYQLISFIDITDDNYENALAIIDARYYDPQILMDREVDDFLKIVDSNFGAGKTRTQKLRETHDLTQRVFGNLKNLVQEVKFPIIEERNQPHFKEMVAQEILDTLVSRIIVQSFDGRSNEKLQQFRSTKRIHQNQTIKLTDVLEFLQQEFREVAPQALRSKSTAPMAFQQGRYQQNRGNQQGSFHCSTPHCYVCDSNKHTSLNCQQFLKLTIKERRDMARRLRLCYMCVSEIHSKCECKSKGRSTPNSALTYPKDGYQKNAYRKDANQKDAYRKDNKDYQASKNHKTHMGIGEVHKANTTLLATARCVVLDKVGHPVILRALIDPGSTCSFITKQAANVLKLRRTQTQVSIQGIGKTHLDADEEMELTIKPHFKCSFEMKIDAIIVESITDQVPARRVHVQR